MKLGDSPDHVALYAEVAEQGLGSVSEDWALGHHSIAPFQPHLLLKSWGCALFTSLFPPWALTE